MAILDGVILDDIKKLLGLDKDYDVFDLDTILGINTVFANLQQLGVGQDEAFQLLDNTEKWSEFYAHLGMETNFAQVKSLIFMRVKLMFDPPTSSFALESYNKQIAELEWRLNVQADWEANRVRQS